MPIIEIQNSLSGDNKGSSKRAISYLEKENKIRDKSKRKNEPFFNQFSMDIDSKKAIKKLDSKRQGLGKDKGKYYSIIIAPSKEELENMSDEDLKDYAVDVMKIYAEHFQKNISPEDIAWFGKLEHYRKHKGFKEKKKTKLNLPPGKKSGDFKTGDNRHIHILVRRKTEKNISTSPLINSRGEKNGFGKGTKMGFNRIAFSAKAEKHIENYTTLYNLKSKQSYIYLKNNKFDYEKAEKLGFNSFDINKVRAKENEKRKKKQQAAAQPEPQKVVPTSAVEKTRRAVPPPTAKKQEEKGRSVTPEELIQIAVNFYLNTNYPNKIRNISTVYKENSLRVAFKKRYNYTLSDEQLKQVNRKVNSLGQKKGKGI